MTFNFRLDLIISAAIFGITIVTSSADASTVVTLSNNPVNNQIADSNSSSDSSSDPAPNPNPDPAPNPNPDPAPNPNPNPAPNPNPNPAPNPNPNSNNPQSSVICENLTTIAKQEGTDPPSPVLFKWETTEFGSEYTPQKRCQIVSAKLNALVQANGGKFSGLKLTNGPVNNRIVICVLQPGEIECNPNNMLFTLKRENERIAGRIIGQLLNIGVNGSGTINEDSGEQVVVDLGTWAKTHFHKSRSTSRQPQNQLRPQPRYVQPSTPAQRPHRGFQ